MELNIWQTYLYQPLFNFLIWIYNNWTNMNFGWAVVYLTVLLRIVLLPFTLITERNNIKNAELAREVQRLEKSYHNDPIVKKEEIRRVLRRRRVQPWAKIVVLGIQLLVLVLLYQVFLRGITGDKILKILYPAIDFPGNINTNFYGFDLGARHDIFWSGLVAVGIFLEVYIEYRERRPASLTKGDLTYFFLFPFVVFLLLWWLPMVKSLFVLTSMVFSAIIASLSKRLFAKQPETGKDAHATPAHH